MTLPTVALAIPMYNESESLPYLFERLDRLFASERRVEFSVVCVDDGSTDNTATVLRRLQGNRENVTVIELARNYGKEIAMAAAFDNVDGDACVVIDADLQDPPELIPEMVTVWLETGADDVYAQRTARRGEKAWKRITSHLFYRLLSSVSRVPIQVDTGDFRLLSKRAVLALRQHRESQRYTKGLYSLIGLRKAPIKYERDPRIAGQTKWRIGSLVNLAVEGVTSFTTVPLRIATLIGLTVSALAFLYIVIIVGRTLLHGVDVPGYASLMSVVLLLGGVQLLAIGLIGEYVGRIFLETKARPLYLLKDPPLEGSRDKAPSSA